MLAVAFVTLRPQDRTRRLYTAFLVLSAGYVLWAGSDSVYFRGDLLSLLW
jgi:hypothetical protein